MLPLLDLQRSLGRALLDGDDSAVAALIAGDGLEPSERLAVYRNNVVSSLTALLHDVFPVICRLVDARFFDYAAHEFIRTRPPSRPRLAEYGADFPDFLAAFPPCADLAYLADVARLEWLISAAAQAPQAPAIVPSALQGIAPADTSRLVLALQPSLRYVASRWPIDRIWRANHADLDGAEIIDLNAGGAWLEIRQTRRHVEFRSLTAPAFVFRRALQQGAPLVTAAEGAFAQDATFDLGIAFADLFRDGAVTSFSLSDKEETSP